MAIGGQVVLLAKNGEAWIGTLLADEPRVIVLLAGSGKRLVAAPARVAGIHTIPAHSFEERKVLIERQRRGEPAAVLRVR